MSQNTNHVPERDAASFLSLPLTESDKSQAAVFYKAHVLNILNNRIEYMFPAKMSNGFTGCGGFYNMSFALSLRHGIPIYCHYDKATDSYRFGQLVDDADRGQVADKEFVLYVNAALSNPLDPQSQSHNDLQGVGAILVASAQNRPAPYMELANGVPQLAAEPPTFASSSTQHITPVNGIPSVAATSPRLTANSIHLRPVPGHISKPRNCWVIYRQRKHAQVSEAHPGMHTSEISKIIGRMWAEETPEVKVHYHKLALEEKMEHKRKYPDYKCTPRKSSAIKTRKANSAKTTFFNNPMRSPTRPMAIPPINLTIDVPRPVQHFAPLEFTGESNGFMNW